MGLSRVALCWINSYLQSRRQRVSHKSDTSDWVTTNLDVPQGSVLEPLLFCLFINDIQHLFTNSKIGHLLYADDLQIYTQVPYEEMDDGVALLSATAVAVSDWTTGSGPRKTQAIYFASKGIRLEDGST